MFGALWELALIGRDSNSIGSCNEVGVSALLGGFIILGLGFWVMAWRIFRAVAFDRGDISPWGCAYFLIGLFLVGGLPIAYGLGTDAHCTLMN
jgi:phosphate/sulfate permease